MYHIPRSNYETFISFQEEIQKLAGQVQYVKIVGMLMENRHIREKKDGYFSRYIK